jgi:hypothetical protein
LEYKEPKVKYEVLIQDYHSGGIKLPDLDCRIKTQRIMWAKRLVSEGDCIWKIIPSFYLKSIGGTQFIRSNFDSNKISKSLPSFYQLILEAWAEFVFHEPASCKEVKLQ